MLPIDIEMAAALKEAFMAARSIGSATISFGLVSIPIRLYVATHSEQLSFNMLHEKCGTRIKQQLFCPHCERVVERGEIVKGYQFAKDRYVTFTDAEIKALEAEANRSVDIHEFVPLATIDPIYYENSHYLGPDKGAEKAYHLLATAMRDTDKGALARFTSHGKENLVLIRPLDGGLVLHTMYYADEVRSFDEIDKGAEQKVRPNEVELARKLIDQLSVDDFHPEQYADTYRERLQAVVEKKIAGEDVTVTEAPPQRAQVIDLMQALKESLAHAGAGSTKSRAAAQREATAKRPAAARRTARRPQRRATKH
jgi:DNA end-binding protein Ku